MEHFPSLSQTFVLGQVRGLIDLGHDVTVYASWGDPSAVLHAQMSPDEIAKCTVYHGSRSRGRASLLAALTARLPRNPLAVLDAVNIYRYGTSALGRMELSHRLHWIKHGPRTFDAIYCHFGPSGRLAERLRRAGLVRGPIATVFHAHDLTRYVRRHGRSVYRDLFLRGDLFIAITEYARQKLLDLNCSDERIAILHAGVDTSAFTFRERRGGPLSPIQLLCVGRMVEKKGFDDALHAVARVQARGLAVKATFAGDGPLLGEYRRTAHELGLEDAAQFPGPVSHTDVVRLMEDADVMVVPSVTAADGDEEGLPTVILEAQASGLPVIATRHAGIPEAVADGESGLLIEEHDVESLAAGIERLAADPELRSQLTHSANAFVRTHFGQSDHVRQLGIMLHDLAESYEDHT